MGVGREVGGWGRGGLNGFKFGRFNGPFPSDGAASMAVKGLIMAVKGLIMARGTRRSVHAVLPAQQTRTAKHSAEPEWNPARHTHNVLAETCWTIHWMAAD